MTTHFSGLPGSHCSGGCAWWWVVQARHGVVSEAAAGTFGYFAALPNELILCILSHTDPKTLLLSGTHLAGWLPSTTVRADVCDLCACAVVSCASCAQ